MAYFPYFRGKQFELIAIKETASLIAEANFTPIIEPVRESLTGLERALDALTAADGSAIVVVNPDCGDFSDDGSPIIKFLQGGYLERGVLAGVLLSGDLSARGLSELLDRVECQRLAFIHAGFNDDLVVNREIEDRNLDVLNIFDETAAGMLYRRRFTQRPKILLSDGFVQSKNSLYPSVERFSDLHVTYPERGLNGFGDYLIIGDNYSETGGPAWAVAIHITYVDCDREGEMFIHHFKSDSNDTPVDPGGKFLEALEKLIDEVNSPETKVFQSTAIDEFRDLYARKHFPGLGYVKKLSVIHHLETIADFEATNPV